MHRSFIAGSLAVALLSGTALSASAAEYFDRIASFPITANVPKDADQKAETVAEIISVSEDGKLLVYTDSPRKALGFIDITDPASPKAGGSLALGGEPTSVKVVGGKAYVAVNTSESFTNPSGKLVAVDLADRKISSECTLPGQPDSVAAKAGILAIAIENERNEEVNDGALPQLPAGALVVASLNGDQVDCAALKTVNMTGLAEVAGEDPEPEFVDVSDEGKVVVTLQENNHVAIVDGRTGTVEAHFSAGSVDLKNIDTKKDGRIDLSGSMEKVAREPDAVRWIDADRFVTANEGDWKGGSRGFTIFNKNGSIAYESGASLEHEIVSLGHYPDKRNKKGVEIEGVETGRFGNDNLIFVGSERGSVVAVYRDTGATPEFLQVLPTGIGPEGLLAIPSRNLFVATSETDLHGEGGAAPHVMIYQRAERAAPTYPTIRSAKNADGLPMGWGALSGLAADKTQAGKLYAITDSFYGAAPRILTIDATKKPALITAETLVTRNGAVAEKLDLEGIAVAQDGFWLASEGNLEKGVKNLLIRVDARGAIQEEINVPAELEKGAKNYGFEGVTVTGSGADETVWLAVQREWADDGKNAVKLLAYKPSDKSWSAVRYPLDSTEAGWIGLSEITAAGDRVIIIERDNQIAEKAKVKKLYAVSLADMKPAKIGGELPLVKKTLVRDLLPDLKAAKGYVLDKVEGFAIDAAGDAYIVTDNDGVDNSSGETLFLKLGKL
ncbi:esterase-like activity of phytase family protein [Microvirga mediterraneensis]|uniref:Esterase-like activity of phytase family protein n=1 Tax=Microvirga mediterraneensis TaxID=2754695 RepID=A0A838BVA3_9HYPH|nr:esterase-like activity of phytase family protein [Microvirga mediterraneensis]MBA1158426.1 esterase-like activity of phytase family protein [Microvirga mediterraneensis]